MKKFITLLFISLLSFGLVVPVLLGSFEKRPEDACLGTWYSGGKKTKVEVYRCSVKEESKDKSWSSLTGDLDFYEDENGEVICGRLIWMKNPNDSNGKPRKDSKNGHKELRDRDLVGITFIYGFLWEGVEENSGKHAWKKGTLYDPNSGSTYVGKLYYNGRKYGDNKLIVRGEWGPFGKSVTWTRFNPLIEDETVND